VERREVAVVGLMLWVLMQRQTLVEMVVQEFQTESLELVLTQVMRVVVEGVDLVLVDQVALEAVDKVQ
jgi:hypothetical protein